MARTKKAKKMPPRAAKANGKSAKDRHKKDGIDRTIDWKGPGPAPAPVPGRLKERRDRAVKKIDWNVPVPADLVAQPDKTQVNATTKHQTILEFVENNRKKKLEFQVPPIMTLNSRGSRAHIGFRLLPMRFLRRASSLSPSATQSLRKPVKMHLGSKGL